MTRSLSRWSGLIWVGIGLATLILFIPSLSIAHQILAVPCTGTGCFDHQVTPAAAERMRHTGYSLTFYATYYTTLAAIFAAVWTALALLLVLRKRSDGLALFTAMAFVCFGCSLFGVMNAPAAAGYTWAPAAEFLNNTGFLSLFILLYIFPDGRFVPGWTRWVALAQVGSLLGTTALPHTVVDADSWPGPLSILPFASLIFTSVYAQIYRYRRVSGGVERQQTKWVVLGAVTALLAFFCLVVLQTLFPALNESSSRASLVVLSAGVSAFLLIPASVAIAILRYRLWDIDVLINRALVYGSLTVTTATLYIGAVIALQALFRALVGQQSDLAIAVATLAVAALFNPWRHRLQSFIDRRFYRRRYDARRTLTAFNSTLRDDVSLDSLGSSIVGVVEQTLQPASVSLWIADEGTLR